MVKSNTKFKSDPNNVSRHAKTGPANHDPINTKERVEQELNLLHARKQTIDDVSTASSSIRKVKKKQPMKKGANARQQKKLARALAVADKEETKIEKASSKAEKRKARKMVWS